MTIMEKYVAALNKGNAEELAELFAEECLFHDTAARYIGVKPRVAHGKQGIYESFSQAFGAYGPVKADIVKLNKYSMEYDVHPNGMDIPCIGCITCDDEGKIIEIIIRAR